MENFTLGEMVAQYISLGGKDPRAARIADKVRSETADLNLLLVEASEATIAQIDKLAE